MLISDVRPPGKLDVEQIAADGLLAEQLLVPLETTWSDNSLSQPTVDDLGLGLGHAYTFPLNQLDLTGLSDDGLSQTLYETGFFDTGTTRSRYGSLDDGRPDATTFMSTLSRAKSVTGDVRENAKERRRTQNRFAQRAYRQRKEQAIKDQEKEIEELKMQLAKEKKLNHALTKVIEFLKERLKNNQSAPSPADTIVKIKSPEVDGKGNGNPGI